VRSSPDELDRLRRFARLLVESVPGMSPTDQFRAEVIGAIAGATSLRQGRSVVRDLLEWTQDVGGAALAEVDGRLSAEGLPSLSLMRSRHAGAVARILTRGVLQSEDDYRTVAASLADTASPLSSADRALAEQLAAAFEASRRKT
jgi:hypothetical protein